MSWKRKVNGGFGEHMVMGMMGRWGSAYLARRRDPEKEAARSQKSKCA